MTTQIIQGDCVEGMRTLPDASVHCCVTSPPYWGLRDYGCDGQIGLESTPEEYVARMVEVFREVRRVLRDDGTCWLNLGDSYSGNGSGSNPSATSKLGSGPGGVSKYRDDCVYVPRTVPVGLKPKDLVGIPWRVAFALQADGWWLRQDIIWHKPNPMPESVRDRCTKAHEYVFLLAKNQKYYYVAEAIAEPMARAPHSPGNRTLANGKTDVGHMEGRIWGASGVRNRRSVWTVSPKPYKGAHFATMPPDLVRPCILAGCPEGGTVLDPFAGSGTTLAVAEELGRNGIGCELNPEYIVLANQRIRELRDACPLLLTQTSG